MDRSKGLAYCGLACCLCGQNALCAGCRNEGCADRDWCKSFHCCKEKEIAWECEQFPCEDNPMLKKPRIRAFASFIAEFGEETMLDCLERNEKAGMVYHQPGQLTGDYDQLEREEEIHRLLFSENHRQFVIKIPKSPIVKGCLRIKSQTKSHRTARWLLHYKHFNAFMPHF